MEDTDGLRIVGHSVGCEHQLETSEILGIDRERVLSESIPNRINVDGVLDDMGFICGRE